MAPLTGHNHPFSGNFNCPIPTCPAVLAQVAPIFFHSSHPSVRERGGWAKSLPIPCGDTVGELRRGALLVPPCVTVSSHCLLSLQ